jgi:hypothetical protein
MSTKDTLGYIQEEGGDLQSTVFNPDSNVTVDGVPNDATGLDDIGDGDGEDDSGEVGDSDNTDERQVSDVIPSVGAKAERSWTDNNGGGMDSEAQSRGMSEDEYRSEIRDKLTELTEDATVRMRLSRDTLRSIVDGDGEFKNQHSPDITTSDGMYSPDARDDIENAKMGTDPDDPPSQKPKYGYLSEEGTDLNDDPREVISYGRIAVEFDDGVKERSTFQRGDSLNFSARPPRYDIEQIPQPVNAPDERVLRASDSDKLSKIEDLDSFTDMDKYTETQMHGGLTLDDVSRVYVTRSVSDELRTKLEDNGIEVVEGT